MYYDASIVGLICVLMQHDRVVEYTSRLPKPHEKNYLVHDLKLATIVFALKQCGFYLYGEIFMVFSYHRSLWY